MSTWESAASLDVDTRQQREVVFDIAGYTLTIGQLPQSGPELGTGVCIWDTAKVAAKFLEHNKHYNVKNKRVLELGSGCGLFGLAIAALGAQSVLLTDIDNMIPLLKRNAAQCSAMLKAEGGKQGAGGAGKVNNCEISVAELPWGGNHTEFQGQSYDYIVGADVVFSDTAVAPLLATIHELAQASTTILLSIEVRATTTQDYFMQEAKKLFSVKKIPRKKYHKDWQHETILLVELKRKASS